MKQAQPWSDDYEERERETKGCETHCRSVLINFAAKLPNDDGVGYVGSTEDCRWWWEGVAVAEGCR